MLNVLTNKQGKGTKRIAKEVPHILKEKGAFGHCECGYEIYYYSDRGIRCSGCAKLYGTWKEKVQK